MYEKFREIAMIYNKSNSFSTYNGNLNGLPVAVHEFYKKFNPVDVEIDYNGLAVRFCPADRLSQLQEEYSYINAQFVFATCNGDPIFLNDDTVYSCSHDNSEKSGWEKLSDNFDDYIKKYELYGR